MKLDLPLVSMAHILTSTWLLQQTIAVTRQGIEDTMIAGVLTPPLIAAVLADPAEQTAAEDLRKHYALAQITLDSFPGADDSEKSRERLIEELAANNIYTGVVSFAQYNDGARRIPLQKDIHTFHVGPFLKGNHPYEPPLLKGIVGLLEAYGLTSSTNGALSGKHLVIVGSEHTLPTDKLLFSLGFLKKYNVTATLVQATAPGLDEITRQADIIAITAAPPDPLTIYSVHERATILNIADAAIVSAVFCSPDLNIAPAGDIKTATTAASILNAYASWKEIASTQPQNS
jgi:5,10-methylene-tetrahydrofolate dehydrogenase/methenyl tetrahydrofolate cyclohydrolase